MGYVLGFSFLLVSRFGWWVRHRDILKVVGATPTVATVHPNVCPGRAFAEVEGVGVLFAVAARAVEGAVGGRRFTGRRRCQLQLSSRPVPRMAASMAV